MTADLSLVLSVDHGLVQLYSRDHLPGLFSRPSQGRAPVRTVQIRALDSYPGGRVAWLVDPADRYNPYAKGLPVAAGRWQEPTFPRSLIWWFNSTVHVLQGIDGGRADVYQITLTRPLRGACASCSVGHG